MDPSAACSSEYFDNESKQLTAKTSNTTRMNARHRDRRPFKTTQTRELLSEDLLATRCWLLFRPAVPATEERKVVHEFGIELTRLEAVGFRQWYE